MAKSPEEQAAAMLANLPEKTGKSIDQWSTLVARSGAAKHGEIVKWLKTEHAVTHGYASLIAHHVLNDGADAPDDDALVEAQYAGKKSLKSIHDALKARLSALGNDVEFAPKKAYVSVRRSKQFALIQPSTKTRVDVGLKLPGRKPGGRLEASGSWNAMVSHRVRLERKDQVDDELVDWLQAAYDQA